MIKKSPKLKNHCQKPKKLFVKKHLYQKAPKTENKMMNPKIRKLIIKNIEKENH